MLRSRVMRGTVGFVCSTSKALAICALIVIPGISQAALYCGKATNQAHVSAGRATQVGYVYAEANGSGDDMGLYYSDSATLQETSAGYFEVVSSCPAAVVGPYENASEVNMPTVVNVTGKYAIAMGGNHFIQNSGSNPQAFPREQVVGTSDTINIPSGATIKYAFLYYGGIIGLDGGDFTADNLGNATDVANNGISFKINGQSYGTYDPTSRLAPGASEVGSNSIVGEPAFHAEFGTLTGTSTSFWSNRVDITGVLQGKAGNLTVDVNPPEEVDVNVNNASSNGGNPAGSTNYNSCLNAANWAIVVVYEHADLPSKQIIIKDDLVRAWDYIWFHKGIWQRPIVKFVDHAPMQSGAKFWVIGQTGNRAGTVTPSSPACTCGCGGTYNLEKGTGYDTPSQFWSNTLVDPQVTWNDPLHRDSTNGPWKLVNQNGTGGQSKRGNEWTLFSSGGKYTEFPNLYEGENVSADNIQPITSENSQTADGDVYDGHPWAGRGQVTYHGYGNDLSAIEVALDDAALTEGATTTELYFKGDQKDVFKPQARISVRFLALEIPTDGQQPANQAPVITLTGGDVTLTEGDNYVEPGYSATDAEDGNLTNDVNVSCDFATAQPVTEGTYTCTYQVQDSLGLSDQKTRNITVNPVGNTAPVITLSGANPASFNEGDSYVEPGYSANDAEDGDLTSQVAVSCTFNTSSTLVAGNYQCTYNVSDSGGLSAATKTRSITVSGNNPVNENAPVITLIGANPVTIQTGNNFVDPGATASDVEDGDLTAAINASCNVNTSAAGTYSCTYTVSDNGNPVKSATATRTVIVEAGNNNVTCTEYTTNLGTHRAYLRAYSSGSWWAPTYYATGSDIQLTGNYWTTVTLKTNDNEPGVYYPGSCE